MRFGMRGLRVNGTAIEFNGCKIMLTGVLDWMFNFDIFSPAMAPEKYRSELSRLKAAGFNAIKFCLVVPPEYILDILDEVGMYAYVEYPMWYERECPDLFRRAYSQLPRLVCQNRNHPCLIDRAAKFRTVPARRPAQAPAASCRPVCASLCRTELRAR